MNFDIGVEMGLELILEQAWNDGGFFETLRKGEFDQNQASIFWEKLKAENLPEGDFVSKRLLQLIWYLPSFLEWQKKRVGDVCEKFQEYEKFVNSVMNQLEEIIGVP